MISAREEGQMVDEDVARYSRERQEMAERGEQRELPMTGHINCRLCGRRFVPSGYLQNICDDCIVRNRSERARKGTRDGMDSARVSDV